MNIVSPDPSTSIWKFLSVSILPTLDQVNLNVGPTLKLVLPSSLIIIFAAVPAEFKLTVDIPSTDDEPVISTEPVIIVLPAPLFLTLKLATSKSVSLSCAVTCSFI